MNPGQPFEQDAKPSCLSIGLLEDIVFHCNAIDVIVDLQKLFYKYSTLSKKAMNRQLTLLPLLTLLFEI